MTSAKIRLYDTSNLKLDSTRNHRKSFVKAKLSLPVKIRKKVGEHVSEDFEHCLNLFLKM